MRKTLIGLAAIAALLGSGAAMAQYRGGGWHGGGGGWHGGGGGWHGGGWRGPSFSFGIGIDPYWGSPYPAYPYPYYYPGPAYPVAPIVIDNTPSTYVERDAGYRYYCPSPAGYFPQVAECPAGWLKVVPDARPTAPPAAPTR